MWPARATVLGLTCLGCAMNRTYEQKVAHAARPQDGVTAEILDMQIILSASKFFHPSEGLALRVRVRTQHDAVARPALARKSTQLCQGGVAAALAPVLMTPPESILELVFRADDLRAQG